MKTAIIAAASGYNISDIEPWVLSLENTNFEGKVFVIVYDKNVELLNYLKEKNFYVLQAQNRGVYNVATQRFEDYIHVLTSEHCEDIDLVIHTDIRDVVFQLNPDTWLRNNIEDAHIVATAEGVTYRHEDWNGDGMQKQYGKAIYDRLANIQTLCSGIIAGRKEALISLFETILELSWYSEEPGAFIDQHFYNVAIRFIYEDITKIVPADSPWVLNCGTMIALPMNAPDWSTGPRTPYNSYERIRKGTYVENMLAPLPYMNSQNLVCTANGEVYPIVHQYDRYQIWKEKLLEKI